MLWLASQRGQVPEGLVDTPALLVEDDEQSEVITEAFRGHQRPSEAIREAVRGGVRGHQRTWLRVLN